MRTTGYLSRNGRARRRVVALASLLGLVLAAAGAVAAAGPRAPARARPSLLYVHMVGPAAGWAVGPAHVWRTVDGGRTWRDVTPRGAALHFPDPAQLPWLSAASFLTAESAWVVGASPARTGLAARLSVYRTSDGGRTWRRATVDAPNAGAFLDVLDAQHLWLLAYQGAAAGSEGAQVWASADGGRTWRLAAEANPTVPLPRGAGPLPFGGDKWGLRFGSARVGWVGVDDAVFGRAMLYATRTAGRSWAVLRPPVPAAARDCEAFTAPPAAVAGPVLLVPLEFLCASPGSRIAFDRSSDGGRRWTSGAPLAAASGAWWRYAFVGPARGWATDGRRVFRTNDGGRAWVELPAAPALAQAVAAGRIAELDFLSPARGWALVRGARGATLLATTDGGVSWRLVTGGRGG